MKAKVLNFMLWAFSLIGSVYAIHLSDSHRNLGIVLFIACQILVGIATEKIIGGNNGKY